MQDFLWAVADKLRRLGLTGRQDKLALYFGRLWQGENTPCFYLPPPSLRRQLLPCGRVRREITLELHYYPRQRKLPDEKINESGIAEQTRIGEGLVRGMGELQGRQRAYRGRNLCWQAGNDYLRFQAEYVYYTTLELEAADGYSDLPESAELMQFFELATNDKQ